MDDKILRVGCYGAKGSYTYEAMEQQFGDQPREESYFPLFEDVIQAVKEGDIDYGVVPIENSSTGGITEVYDLIRRYNCAVVGEQIVKIEHNLLALPGTKLEDIDTVFSHPQGFAQCRPFFNKHRDWTLKPYFSTSRSAEKVAEDRKKNQAAVASKTAARLYGLEVIAENIFFNSSNYTRFFIIGPKMEITEKSDKITLVLSVRHEPGRPLPCTGLFLLWRHEYDPSGIPPHGRKTLRIFLPYRRHGTSRRSRQRPDPPGPSVHEHLFPYPRQLSERS